MEMFIYYILYTLNKPRYELVRSIVTVAPFDFKLKILISLLESIDYSAYDYVGLHSISRMKS